VTKDLHSEPDLANTPIEQFEAGHPLPDDRGLRATRRILELAAEVGPRDLVICLISGGGSALLSAPVPQLGLSGLSALTERLLASGADIHEFNTVRKHLSLVKGGQLAKAAAPAQVLTLILSDVVGDDLGVIASGPTVPDKSTFQDAAAVLKKYGQPLPIYIQDGLAGLVPETPKPGDPFFERVSNLLVGTNRMAAEAAITAAQSRGFRSRLLTVTLTGEAQKAGAWLAGQLAQMPPRSCWVAGGETTVTLGPDPGLGGRNLETALAAVSRVAGLERCLLLTLATDGGDGPTDAAGAVVSGDTLARAVEQNMDPNEFLRRHDAYPFFAALGDLIKTGPTRTNVNDLCLLFTLGERT
jgi:hydroxypyruvate reductase